MTDSTILVLLIVVLVLLVVAIVILGILFYQQKKVKPEKEDTASIGALLGGLKADVTSIKENAKTELKAIVQEEMLAVSKQQATNIEASNNKLTTFQESITKNINDKMNTLTTDVNKALEKMNEKVEERLNEGFKSTTANVTKLVESLTKVEEARKQVEGLSSQVDNLSNILSNNQQRGRFGEFTLERILDNVFGETNGLYALQHQIKADNGSVQPDAVVFLPEPYHLVAVDAKFPFVEYEKIFDGEGTEEEIKKFKTAVKKQIDNVGEKYIIKGQTAQQAIMFIPSDGIYAYINHHLPELFQHASNKNVVLASPATLQPLLVSVRGLLVEYERSEQLEVLNQALKNLGAEFARLTKRWNKLNTNLTTAYNASTEFNTTVNKITNKFDKISENQINLIEE